MSDLSKAHELSGTVHLYDIDFQAAKNNKTIGNRIHDIKNGNGNFSYVADENIADALKDADFVIISILPGTFDEMESDVHAPERYGIILPLIHLAAAPQVAICDAAEQRSLEKAFAAFVCDNLVTTDISDSKELFDTMIDNTKKYL